MNAFHPWQPLLVALAGWINRQQQDVIAYIQEENRILKNKPNPDGRSWRESFARLSPIGWLRV